MTAITEMKKKCPMCDEEFLYRDLRNVPNTCGKHICVTNYAYQQAHHDPRTGYKPSPEEIREL